MSIIHQLRCRVADLRGRGVYAGWPNQHQAIFIHLPKTAGSSISKGLGLSTSRHVPAADYRKTNPAKFARFFKFAFVRNPYDRLVSSYAFLMGGGMNSDDALFAEAHVRPYDNFEHFIMEGLSHQSEIQAWVHFRPQVAFVCDAAGRNLMDFTGRFERLTADYDHISKRLGQPRDLPVTNTSRRGDYREAYTPATIDIVRRLYTSDLENFEYGFD